MTDNNWKILERRPDVELWHETDQPSQCQAHHPYAQSWEQLDILLVTEIRCWRTPHDNGPHYFMNPPRCDECGAIDLHGDGCSQPDAGRDSWVEWQAGNS